LLLLRCRLLTHRSFKTFKVVEYLFTILATLTDQGPPMVWVSNHRYHHMHADTPLDPHTPYEGMWQAYMGWLFQQDKWRAVLDRTNVDDMKADPFHRFISATFPVWMIGRFVLTYVSVCC
jgi:stearoyl-CoA desaturase (delta-9 desaturase)